MINPQRLVEELNSLHQGYLSLNNFELTDALAESPVLKMVVVTLSNNTYCLLAELKSYPEKMPDLYVLEELKMRDGKKMGLSSAMHCLGTANGRTRICYGNTSHWRPDTHLYDLYIKGKLWLEAYDYYMKTGTPIRDILIEQ